MSATTPVRYGDCARYERTIHSHIGHRARGRLESPAGLWGTHPRACVHWYSQEQSRGGPGVAVFLLGAVVLPLKGNVVFIEADEARVGDSDPVGVSGEILEYSASFRTHAHSTRRLFCWRSARDSSRSNRQMPPL